MIVKNTHLNVVQ
jgi:hypothetical protein